MPTDGETDHLLSLDVGLLLGEGLPDTGVHIDYVTYARGESEELNSSVWQTRKMEIKHGPLPDVD